MDNLFASTVYLLCFLTSAACAWLLGRSYLKTRTVLLFWSSLCFVLLAMNNLILVIDLLVIPTADLRLGRLGFALAAVAVLLFGFIWEDEL